MIDQLRQRQRHHREIDAAGSDRQCADRERQPAAAGEPQQYGTIPRHPELPDRDAGDVGASTEKRGMSERQQPGVPEQKIVTHGENAVDQDVHCERLRWQHPWQ
jgi:hypothetical protein